MPCMGDSMPVVYVVYRVLYGADFIQESIKSIALQADKIFVCIADRPFGNTTGVTYKGKWVSWPAKFDNLREKIQELIAWDSTLPDHGPNHTNRLKDKIVVLDDYCESPKNQLTHIVNDLILPHHDTPDIVMMMEPDHVFDEWGASDALYREFDEDFSVTCATTDQVELWKTPEWRIPNRPNRVGPVLHKMKRGEPFPETGFNGTPIIGEVRRLYTTVHNMGFCLSPETMYWKHLTALAFSKVIGDSEPNEDWYEEKWLNWNPETNNTNLEISKGFEHTIPHAYKHDPSELPKLIIEKYGIQRK